MSALVIQACGPMTTLQDGGRLGWQRYGVSPSGAMDRLALATANALVGNLPGAAAIEFVLLGGSVAAEDGPVRVAIAGAPTALSRDGESLPAVTSVLLHPGERLSIGAAQAGIYMYLAVEGGFSITPALGSLSLHARARIGGYQGRPLREGDRLPLAHEASLDQEERALDAVPLGSGDPIRVVMGPQDDYFTPQGLETFLGQAYAVSGQADRMGYRLTGPAVEHAKGANIVSDGIVTGAVQVPGSGEPIVMMADRQTTGGYPKIATVISADLRVLAHRRAGEAVRFAAIPVSEAGSLARQSAMLMASLGERAWPVRSGLPGVEELLMMNLAGAAVSGLDAGP